MMVMKKKIKAGLRAYMVVLPLSGALLLTAMPTEASAQLAIAEVIKAGVKKLIKAVDLKVQRLQNETIWLQNAQKVLENTLSKLKLEEISDWTQRQRDLYSGYYSELVKVKSLISTYKRVRDLVGTQGAIVQEYKWASGLFKKDKHFSASELAHMEEVYEGILKESLQNLDELFMVVNAFKTQMTDGARLELINGVAEKIEGNFSDLKAFNDRNIILTIQRSKSILETKQLKEVYEIN
ncbi:conjugal transfer protein TraI [Pedobacter paludis]|nr:conjugal transfer protein TraI [Pedobacter paludis]